MPQSLVAVHHTASVVGAGPMGTFFAARMSSVGADVHLVARAKPFEHAWLRVRSTEWDAIATDVFLYDDPDQVPVTDICLVVVPLHEIPQLRGFPPSPYVVSLCNGIDSRERVQAVDPSRNVIFGATTAIVEADGPGQVVQHSHGHRIVLCDGPVPGSARRAASLLRALGLDASSRRDRLGEIWRHAAFILPIAAGCIRYRGTIGDLRADPERWSELVAASDELIALAACAGATVDVTDRNWTYQRAVRKLQPSIARRVLAGDLGEWPLILEPVYALAEQHGHPLTALRALAEAHAPA